MTFLRWVSGRKRPPKTSKVQPHGQYHIKLFDPQVNWNWLEQRFGTFFFGVWSVSKCFIVGFCRSKYHFIFGWFFDFQCSSHHLSVGNVASVSGIIPLFTVKRPQVYVKFWCFLFVSLLYTTPRTLIFCGLKEMLQQDVHNIPAIDPRDLRSSSGLWSNWMTLCPANQTLQICRV